ncbi:hypothetical protein WR25_23473 [Diploscapter pachys]|uniref:Uncharacterized protein n=1 Tax=Diploscapter pachys TaxID=2018661 RepID=A0A2A2KER8_9BILA|nr:hypothetical protein WR25_23473 [Diploscapter pachys]
MLELTDTQIGTWVATFILPLFRVTALLMTMPIFGTKMLPARVRLYAALAITVVIVPALPPLPPIDPLSLHGVLLCGEQTEEPTDKRKKDSREKGEIARSKELNTVAPVLLLLFVISFVAPIALGGFLFSGSLLQPKFSRMNPLSGIKRMFSLNALTELVKAMAKFFMILIVALVVLSADHTRVGGPGAGYLLLHRA